MKTCVFSSDRRRGQKSKLQGMWIYIQVPFLLIRIPGFEHWFLQPRDLTSRARYLHHVRARARARVYIVSCLRSDRISLVQSTRCAVFFFLRDVTRVDNFHAEGRGRWKREKKKKEINPRVNPPFCIRVAQTHQITIPSDGRVPLTFRPRRLSSYWRLSFLFVPAARGRDPFSSAGV